MSALSFVALSLQTTHLDPSTVSKITYVKLVDGNVTRIDSIAVALPPTGTDQDPAPDNTAGPSSWQAGLAHLKMVVGKLPVVSYYRDADKEIFQAASRHLGDNIPHFHWLDCRALARRVLPELPEFQLSTVMKALDLYEDYADRSTVEQTAQIVLALADHERALSVRELWGQLYDQPADLLDLEANLETLPTMGYAGDRAEPEAHASAPAAGTELTTHNTVEDPAPTDRQAAVEDEAAEDVSGPAEHAVPPPTADPIAEHDVDVDDDQPNDLDQTPAADTESLASAPVDATRPDQTPAQEPADAPSPDAPPTPAYDASADAEPDEPETPIVPAGPEHEPTEHTLRPAMTPGPRRSAPQTPASDRDNTEEPVPTAPVEATQHAVQPSSSPQAQTPPEAETKPVAPPMAFDPPVTDDLAPVRNAPRPRRTRGFFGLLGLVVFGLLSLGGLGLTVLAAGLFFSETSTLLVETKIAGVILTSAITILCAIMAVVSYRSVAKRRRKRVAN